MPENPQYPFARRALRFAIGVGGVYALLGVVWIMVSDEIVASISSDPGWLHAAQRYKGLFFIVATMAALVLLVRAGYLRMLAGAAQLHSRELQVQDLFMRHPQPMWVYDSDTLAFLKVNEAAVRQYGYSEAEFLQMTLKDIRPEADVPELLAWLEGPHSSYRDRRMVGHRKRSGEIMAVHVLAYDLPYEGRSAVMVMAMDITQEVAAEQALERQQAQFRQLHQSLGEVLWMATADGSELIYVSPAFETLYGRSSAEFHRELGLWLDCVHPEDREHAAASRQQLAALGHSVCEYRICRPDGSVRWLSDRKCKIIDDTGRVTMIGGIAEDITVLKERDAALATTQAQLEAMVAERTIALQRVNAELDSFARTAAHDMKSPLHAIAGFSQLVQLRYGEALGPEGRRMVARIEQSAFDMSTLVNDLLTLSRMTTTELCLTEVDLAALAGEIIEALRQQEPQRVVSFEAPPRAIVRCDAGLARSLMSNLLGNAWKFTGRREQGRICLAVHESARGTVISVEDNGAGFDTSKSEQLFRPFQRLHSASEFAGTGLGLATCQRIVHRHGGEIWASSTPGLGTTLSFTMAATPRPHGADAAADLLQRAAADVGPSPAGLAGGARGDALLAPAAD